MKINPYIFRAYDIRGVYPDDLDEKIAYRIAQALAEAYPASQKMVVARDPRLSSPALSEAVIKALLDSGKEVINLGIAPDPLFYFAIYHKKYDGGIMISGSHNPPQYNGMTLNARRSLDEGPEDIIQEELVEIRKMVEGDKAFPKAEKTGSMKNAG